MKLNICNMHAFWTPAEIIYQFTDRHGYKLITSLQKNQTQKWNFTSTSLPIKYP